MPASLNPAARSNVILDVDALRQDAPAGGLVTSHTRPPPRMCASSCAAAEGTDCTQPTCPNDVQHMADNKHARKQRVTQPLKNVVDLLEEFARYFRLSVVVFWVSGVRFRALESRVSSTCWRSFSVGLLSVGCRV